MQQSPSSFAAILSNQELLADLNFHIDSLLPKLMEVSPKDRNAIDSINERIFEHYLNGSREVSRENAEGFQKVIKS